MNEKNDFDYIFELLIITFSKQNLKNGNIFSLRQ